MSNDPNGEARQLTLDDPVSPQTIQQLERIQQAQGGVAMRLLNMEQEKIQLLGMAKRLSEENNKLFAMELQARGLPYNTAVDLVDGRLRLQNPPPPAQQAQQREAPPAADKTADPPPAD